MATWENLAVPRKNATLRVVRTFGRLWNDPERFANDYATQPVETQRKVKRRVEQAWCRWKYAHYGQAFDVETVITTNLDAGEIIPGPSGRGAENENVKECFITEGLDPTLASNTFPDLTRERLLAIAAEMDAFFALVWDS